MTEQWGRRNLRREQEEDDNSGVVEISDESKKKMTEQWGRRNLTDAAGFAIMYFL